MSCQLIVKKLSAAATIPRRASAFAAGYDLSSACKCTVPARGKELVATDLAIALPDGVYGRIAPRSGLAWKHAIDVGAGVIDQDYRGNVGVVLFNHSDSDFKISPGDRIAQLILERIATGVEVVECSTELPSLAPTVTPSASVPMVTPSPHISPQNAQCPAIRGTGGFGSTGV